MKLAQNLQSINQSINQSKQLINNSSLHAATFFTGVPCTNTKAAWVVKTLAALSLGAALAACGGGGGAGDSGTGGSGGSGGSGGTGSASTSVSSLTGIAATGAAIASSTLTAKCSDGSTSTTSQTGTTSATGTFTLSLSTGSVLPCVVQVQIKDAGGTVIDRLHGLAASADSSGSAVVNINQITDAIVGALLATTDIESVFANPSSANFTTLKNSDTTASWNLIKTTLSNAGIAVSAITGSPLSQVFSANSTGYDKVLDDLKAKGFTSEHLNLAAQGKTVPPNAPTGKLNDTGIDWCTENITTASTWVNNVVCATYSWVGNLWGQQQDAFFGRDKEAKDGTLTKIGGGMAGFDFTKIGTNGRALKVQNAAYSDSGTEAAGTKWDCVRDNVTGLLWEVKRNDAAHLRHKAHSYTWYEPDSTKNGGSAGQETGGTCTGVADTAKCNTKSYVTAVNTAGICGFKDWRMPNVEELRNLAHTGRSNPAIDINYFPHTQSSRYWSSSPFTDDSDFAWYVFFDDGYVDYGIKNYANFVRLVRSGQ